MSVILTGFMGTGKTTVGRRLAHRLGKQFIDTDERVEESEGRPIAAIFETDGEAHFRAVERRVIGEAVKTAAVVATGGGAIADPINYQCMHQAGPIICLTAGLEEILQRTSPDQNRPLLGVGNRRVRVHQLLSERAAAYAQADLTIDTSGRSVDAIVEEILSYLRRIQDHEGVQP